MPRGLPAARGVGSGGVGWGGVGSGPRAATPRPAALRRPASACPALGSNFRSSSRGPGGHAHWRAQAPRPGRPLWPPGLVRRPTDEPTASAPALGHAPSSAAGARPLYPDDARSGIPRPLRARSSPRPPPPVTCAARMWLGADVGSRCGPGPAHPRGRAAHTEPRRARRLSRLPQCAARLRPRLGEVVPNVAARHP